LTPVGLVAVGLVAVGLAGLGLAVAARVAVAALPGAVTAAGPGADPHAVANPSSATTAIRPPPALNRLIGFSFR
jgi:hypothetical protein